MEFHRALYWDHWFSLYMLHHYNLQFYLDPDLYSDDTQI